MPLTDASGNILYFQWGDTKGWTQEQIDNGEFKATKENYKFYDILVVTKTVDKN